MGLEPQTEERVRSCLDKHKKLTLGEIELLRALQAHRPGSLTFLEEQELRNIERKLGLN
jgi:hypothetical protein